MRIVSISRGRKALSFCLSAGILAGSLTAQLNLAASGQSEAPADKSPPAAATGDIQKFRDEIQLKAMEEAADKICLVASDMYAEASKGGAAAETLDHPQKQAAKLLPAGVSGSTDISWSGDAKPSSDWLGVFVAELNNWFPLLNEEMSQILLPEDTQPVVKDQWAQVQTDISNGQANYKKLQSLVLTSPPDGPTIAEASRSLYYNMQSVRKSITDIYRTIEATNTSQEGAPSTWKGVANAAPSSDAPPGTSPVEPKNQSTPQLSGHAIKTSAGMQELHEATIKMSRTSRDLMGELERWNLLWGQPPADNANSGMLWGGGLTKEEVLSEFRDMPLTVFTSPNYVKFFSYRLPPRKKWLLVYTRQLGQLINMMAKVIAQTEPPDDSASGDAAQWSEIKSLSSDIAARYINLFNLVEGTTDDRLKKSIRADQLTFGEPVAAIYQDVTKMAELLRGYNSKKDSNKAASKAS